VFAEWVFTMPSLARGNKSSGTLPRPQDALDRQRSSRQHVTTRHVAICYTRAFGAGLASSGQGFTRRRPVSMLVGHIATGVIVGTRIRQVSVGTWVLASVLSDLLVFVFVLTGIERIEFLDGRGAGRYFRPVEIGFSHSLLAGVLWGGLFALILVARGHSRRIGASAAMLVIGHWALDAISHPPDMPLAPGLTWRAGLGLWTSIPATLVIEGGLWLTAILLYARCVKQTKLGRRAVYWAGAAIITLVWVGNVAGPPPPNPSTAPIASLVVFALFVAWGYGIAQPRQD
jgi:hypothetical protein